MAYPKSATVAENSGVSHCSPYRWQSIECIFNRSHDAAQLKETHNKGKIRQILLESSPKYPCPSPRKRGGKTCLESQTSLQSSNNTSSFMVKEEVVNLKSRISTLSCQIFYSLASHWFFWNIPFLSRNKFKFCLCCNLYENAGYFEFRLSYWS